MKNLESFESFMNEKLGSELEFQLVGGTLHDTDWHGKDGSSGTDIYDDTNQRISYIK